MNKTLLSTLLCLACCGAMAQINVSGAKRTTLVGADSVYWFSSLADASITLGSANTSSVEIKKYDTDNNLFISILKKEVLATAETYKPETEGAFEAEVVNNGQAQKRRFWCVAPKIENVDFEIDSVTCQGLFAQAKAEAKAIELFDFEKNIATEQPQVLVYEWSLRDSVVLTTSLPEAELPTPVEDGILRLLVTNQCFAQAEKTDSVESYGVRAQYKAEVRERNVPNELSSADFYSAPVEVELKNLSKGQIDVSEWALGNTTRLFDRNAVYTFQQSGEYRVALTVTNESTGCQSTDSTTLIKITEAALEFPDVFTPNGDGTNDEFRPAYKSLKTYKLTVFNRWGREVFSSTDPSTGWDGKINSANAATGTYYYYAEAEGFDRNVLLRRKGTVTLLRGE